MSKEYMNIQEILDYLGTGKSTFHRKQEEIKEERGITIKSEKVKNGDGKTESCYRTSEIEELKKYLDETGFKPRKSSSRKKTETQDTEKSEFDNKNNGQSDSPVKELDNVENTAVKSMSGDNNLSIVEKNGDYEYIYTGFSMVEDASALEIVDALNEVATNIEFKGKIDIKKINNKNRIVCILAKEGCPQSEIDKFVEEDLAV